MDLYFSPLACSFAARATLYEAGVEATFIEVDPKTKLTLGDGTPYHEIHPLGLVPLLRDGEHAISENSAILQYLAERHPHAQLAPRKGFERTRLQQWLGFISTELHKGLFVPLLDAKAPEVVKSYTLQKYRGRLDYLAQHLQGRLFLLDHFSVADAYLVAVLNWSAMTPLKLTEWPAIASYHERLRARPSFERAFVEELGMYQRELARHATA